MLKLKDIKIGSLMQLEEKIAGFNDIYFGVVLTKPVKTKHFIRCKILWLDKEMYGIAEEVNIFNNDIDNWTKLC